MEKGNKIDRPLSKEQCLATAELLRSQVPHYTLTLVFTEEKIDGDLVVSFSLEKAGRVYIGYEGVLNRASVNGADINISQSRVIPLDCKEGQNSASFGFTSKWSKRWGCGPVLLKEDGQNFVYMISETQGSSFLFPCFDFPGIRGVYKLNLMYPECWGPAWTNGDLAGGTMPSNKGHSGCGCHGGQTHGQGNKALEVGSDGAITPQTVVSFVDSPPLPAYLFYIVVGNYNVKTFDDVPAGAGDLGGMKRPREYLTLPHATKIIEPNLRMMDLATCYTLDYFSKLLGYKYPFDKYSHCFVPSDTVFVAADELPGMIIVDEYFGDRRSKFYWTKWMTILAHEMAHMWFGDLITIPFWDLVWLKETFADLLGVLGLENMARLQEEGTADFGLGPHPRRQVSLLKFKRKIDGFLNVKSMTCGGCVRALSKTDIHHLDEAFSAYTDDVYGRSLFELHQYMMPHLQPILQRVVKEFAWKNITEEGLLKICKAVGEEHKDTHGWDEAFHQYFHAVGYEEIPLAVSGQQQVTVGAKGWACERRHCIDSTAGDIKLAPGKHEGSLMAVHGPEVVIDSKFYSSAILRIDLNQYVAGLSDATLMENIMQVYSQAIMSNYPLDQGTFDRLVRLLNQGYRESFAYYDTKLADYFRNLPNLDLSHWTHFLQSLYEEYFTTSELQVDYFDLFKVMDIQDETRVEKILSHLQAHLLPADERFDHYFLKIYLQYLPESLHQKFPSIKDILSRVEFSPPIDCPPTLESIEKLLGENRCRDAREILILHRNSAIGSPAAEKEYEELKARIKARGGNMWVLADH